MTKDWLIMKCTSFIKISDTLFINSRKDGLLISVSNETISTRYTRNPYKFYISVKYNSLCQMYSTSIKTQRGLR